MRIQTFQFLISNYVGNEVFNTTKGREKVEHYKTPQFPRVGGSYGSVRDSSEIDGYINGFLEGKKVIDIKVDTYTIHRHNNSYCDSVVARYTIIYDL